jgi:hypothetical protein
VTTAAHVAYNEAGYRIGETHHNASISEAQVQLVRDLHEHDGKGLREIAELLDLSVHTVRRICDYSRRGQTARSWKRMPGGLHG